MTAEIRMSQEKCGLCGVGFMRGEIPFRGLVSDEPMHQSCYRETYAAIEYDKQECIQSRNREHG